MAVWGGIFCKGSLEKTDRSRDVFARLVEAKLGGFVRSCLMCSLNRLFKTGRTSGEVLVDASWLELEGGQTLAVSFADAWSFDGEGFVRSLVSSMFGFSRGIRANREELRNRWAL